MLFGVEHVVKLRGQKLLDCYVVKCRTRCSYFFNMAYDFSDSSVIPLRNFILSELFLDKSKKFFPYWVVRPRRKKNVIVIIVDSYSVSAYS